MEFEEFTAVKAVLACQPLGGPLTSTKNTIRAMLSAVYEELAELLLILQKYHHAAARVVYQVVPNFELRIYVLPQEPRLLRVAGGRWLQSSLLFSTRFPSEHVKSEKGLKRLQRLKHQYRQWSSLWATNGSNRLMLLFRC